MKKKINSKFITCTISVVVLLLIIVLLIKIYNNLFPNTTSKRLEGIENYKLTSEEVDAVKDKINELDNIESIDIHTNEDHTKIITIFITLKEDIDLKKIETKLDETISLFSEQNLEFYDIQVYVDSKNEESEVYPQIGYKHKTSSSFAW